LLFSNFITQLINTFIKPKTNKLIVYAHNFAKFDGVLLLKHLLPFGKVDPLLYNGKFISITLKILVSEDNELSKFNGKTIVFKDSLLLLPDSLKNLAVSYNCVENKGVFPFNFNYINYIGEFPQIEYFKNITIDNYLSLSNKFSNKLWSFKEESIKYCKLDCFILFEILTKFNELVFNEFKINVHKSLTLPSLAVKIFKTHFMPEDKLYQLHGKIEQNIRESYTGGAVDVYIPHNRITPWVTDITNIEYETLYYYDVNGLYPTVMSTKPLPIGKPTIFEGNIRSIEDNPYGFFYCKITSPTYLEHPILQRRIKTVNGIKTIAGLGTWEGWIYSEEMYNAEKFGYTFEVIKGYKFDKGDLFKSYINKLYQLRLEYPKGHPLNQIAKLLQNSLYGKFGMRDEITLLEILNNISDEDKAIVSAKLDLYNTDITDIIQLVDHILLIRKSFTDLAYNEKEDLFHGTEVNVAIASAITAESRIFMTVFKNNPDFKIYYSDTDSIVTNKPLPDSMIGNKLGQVKLEYVIKKAVFLAPKVYAFVTDDNKEIIKVKGLKHDVIDNLKFNDLEALLIKDSSREFTQEKWFKNVMAGEISISDQIYTLKATSNKREAIYVNDVFDNTKPYNYNEIK
jgi:hypothetical protein